jgi:hypothetical protein
MTIRALYTERTNRKILIIGAGLVIVGVLLVWFVEEPARHSGYFLILRELGSLLVPTGLVALAWELLRLWMRFTMASTVSTIADLTTRGHLR